MINETFKNNLNSIGVELTDRQYEQFDMYYKLLVEWNSFMNLTGITDYEEVLLKHYVDSLVLDIEKIGHKKKEISLIDVGTGAGFPGLPLKIAYPQINVVLLDSLNKRVKFLNQVIEELGLTGIETVHSRAEDGGRNNDLREHFDVSVSRAVANLATLVEYNLPFVKVGGYFVAYKSGDIDEELVNAKKAVSVLGGTIEEVKKIGVLPGIKIRGFMTSAPFVENPEDNRKYFRELKQLLVDINNKNIDNVYMNVLSMGMTNDYTVAVEEGATHVRVGTAIFGARDYSH